MLVFDSKQRITAQQALLHPYFDPYRNQNEKQIAVIPFDWSFTNTDLASDMWRMMTMQEVMEFTTTAGGTTPGSDSPAAAVAADNSNNGIRNRTSE